MCLTFLFIIWGVVEQNLQINNILDSSSLSIGISLVVKVITYFHHPFFFGWMIYKQKNHSFE